MTYRSNRPYTITYNRPGLGLTEATGLVARNGAILTITDPKVRVSTCIDEAWVVAA